MYSPRNKLQTYCCCRVNNFGFGDFTGTICNRLKKPKTPNNRKPTNLEDKQVVCKNQKKPRVLLFPPVQLHNMEKIMEEKSEKGSVRAATVERIVSVAPTTGCKQLCSFLPCGSGHLFSIEVLELEVFSVFHDKEVN